MHFELEKTNLVMTNLIFFFVIFIAHIWSQIHKASFDIFFSFAGGLGPSPPSSGYAYAPGAGLTVQWLTLDNGSTEALGEDEHNSQHYRRKGYSLDWFELIKV